VVHIMWTMESFLLGAQGSPSLPRLPRCSAHVPTARQCGPHSSNGSRQHSSSLSSTSLCRAPRAPEDDRRQRHGSQHAARMRTSVADRPQVTAADGRFLKWLEGQAAPIEKVSIRSQHRAGEDIDMTVRWGHRETRCMRTCLWASHGAMAAGQKAAEQEANISHASQVCRVLRSAVIVIDR